MWIRMVLISLSLSPSFLSPPRCGGAAPSWSPGAAVSVAGRLAAALAGRRAGQHAGQQHLPEEGGPERELHGGHRRQDAEQGSADQHHPQVRPPVLRGTKNHIAIIWTDIAIAIRLTIRDNDHFCVTLFLHLGENKCVGQGIS